jgi:hypothetical protein
MVGCPDLTTAGDVAIFAQAVLVATPAASMALYTTRKGGRGTPRREGVVGGLRRRRWKTDEGILNVRASM